LDRCRKFATVTNWKAAARNKEVWRKKFEEIWHKKRPKSHKIISGSR
jgi:hypothetical protein